MRIFYPGDQVWLRNNRRGKKWIKVTIISKVGTVMYKVKVTIISKVGTVMYKVKCCNEIFEKYIDQLSFHPDIETEQEVKDTSPLEQNLTLHPIPHIIETNQSNQTIISPPSNNTLSDNPTSTSSPQSPDNPVPIEPNINTSTQQSHTSLCIARDRPK